MSTALRFDLAAALDLAEHTLAAPRHQPVADEPTGPALLLVADDGVYLIGNGQPPMPPAADQPAASTVRAVYADGLGSGSDWMDLSAGLGHDDLLVPLPLRAPADRPLIGLLRTAATRGHTTVILTVTDTALTVTTMRRRVRAHR